MAVILKMLILMTYPCNKNKGCLQKDQYIVLKVKYSRKYEGYFDQKIVR